MGSGLSLKTTVWNMRRGRKEGRKERRKGGREGGGREEGREVGKAGGKQGDSSLSLSMVPVTYLSTPPVLSLP